MSTLGFDFQDVFVPLCPLEFAVRLAHLAPNDRGGVHEIAWNWQDADHSLKSLTIPTLNLFRGQTETHHSQILEVLQVALHWLSRHFTP
ncbi:hypothetical protein [Deinococcus roseus]|uniref:Uncharacterized protein n=1 Tax=Deinococcus roseus TaxID=392414 RepID=A0ABQ2CZK9_9DEIO|nr:hypothetical protein [Deinococcus roseus]GGJ36139.1 hypothetical protein GCM10008938_22800 [Deinococcus roseus]